MRLVLLTGEYPPQPGGVGDYTCRLADALRARSHTVAVLTLQHGVLTIYQGAEDDPVRLPGADLDWSYRVWPAVIAALDRLRPDWLHIQYQTGAYAMSPGLNALPWRLRGLAGRPHLAVTFHDLLVPYLFPKAGPLRRWANLLLARSADAVVVSTHADAQQLGSAVVIPIGSNIPLDPPRGYERAAWRAELGVAPNEMLVAYFGLLSPSKGAEVLLEALARLTPPWRLLLIGGAATAPQDVRYAETLRSRLSTGGLGRRVISTGHVPDQTVSAHLLAADCVALPFRDGASFRRGSLLAALAHGCPVVTTTPADAATTASLATAALLVPPDDPAALHAALERLSAEPALRRQLAVEGRALAAGFSWAQIAAQHEQLYQHSTG